MASKNEFKFIEKMYKASLGKAYRRIEDCEKQDAENPNEDIRTYGSALTGLLKRDLEKATEKIEGKWSKDEEGHLTITYDKKDALKMLQAIEIINTHIL